MNYKIVAKQYKSVLTDELYWETTNELNGEIAMFDDFSEVKDYAQEVADESGEQVEVQVYEKLDLTK